MMHGSLGTERVAVRRNPNGGEGFVETHGLHGNLWKLFYAAVNWGHHVDQTGTKRIFEKSCAAVRFPATPCPESISGERHAVRWGAPPCDACKLPIVGRSAAGITALQGLRKCQRDGQPCQLRPAVHSGTTVSKLLTG